MAMKLEGGERLILKSLADLQGPLIEYVDDARLADATKMRLEDVRDWLETLEGKGFVERARLIDGFAAYVTAKGKQTLSMMPLTTISGKQPGSESTAMGVESTSRTRRLPLTGREKALVVGISDYPLPITSLPAVANDVREIASLLKSENGQFPERNVAELVDQGASRQDVLDALEQIFRDAGPDDTLFVYLAGDGAVEGDQYYFVAHDTDPDRLTTTGVPLVTIRDWFDTTKSQRAFLWLDFCHSGGILARGLMGGPDDREIIERTLKVVQGHGKLIVAACTASHLAYELDAVGHGLFTASLLRGLKGEAAYGGEVTVNSLFDFIDRQMGTGRQRPMMFGQMTGRIVLIDYKEESSPVKVEEVFRTSGIPSFTFVEPVEFNKLMVSLRTPGKGVVVEGPSGVGKTTAVLRGLEQSKLSDKAVKLSARRAADKHRIDSLTDKDRGIFIIDDFHRLDDSAQKRISNLIKVLADEDKTDIKIVIIGINNVGESLIRFSLDLSNKLDVFKFQASPDYQILEMIKKGELALNITIDCRQEIRLASLGSFLLAQRLCQEACITSGILEAKKETRAIETSYQLIKSRVLEHLTTTYKQLTRKFVSGGSLPNVGGRAPYLHILRWLSESSEWSISLWSELAAHPDFRVVLRRIISKGELEKLLRSDAEFARILHFDSNTSMLIAEDPQFVFWLKAVNWNQFAKSAGYTSIAFPKTFDFALLYAPSQAIFADRLYERLIASDFSVYYDRQEELRHIAAASPADYLRPIYDSDSELLLPLLSTDFPRRVLYQIESDLFKKNFSLDSIVPIWFSDCPEDYFNLISGIHGLRVDVNSDRDEELERIVDQLRLRIAERRVDRSIESEAALTPKSSSGPKLPNEEVAMANTSVGEECGQTMALTKPVKLFYSYSHKDEALRKKLNNHLAILEKQGLIDGWHDRKIMAGSEWEGEIDKHLKEADIVLLLVSDNFIASNYCYDIEVKLAVERHNRGDAVVIPVILKPVDWSGAPFGKLQALPTDGKPITKWTNRDDAFKDIATGIRVRLQSIE